MVVDEEDGEMKAYLYCVKGSKDTGYLHYLGGGVWGVTDERDCSYNGIVVAECEIDGIERWKTEEFEKTDEVDGREYAMRWQGAIKDRGNGEFASDRAERKELEDSSCLSMDDIIRYAGGIGKTFYAWRLKRVILNAMRLSKKERIPQSWKYFRDGVLVSIRPKWLAKILNKEKTAELRKTRFTQTKKGKRK